MLKNHTLVHPARDDADVGRNGVVCVEEEISRKENIYVQSAAARQVRHAILSRPTLSLSFAKGNRATGETAHSHRLHRPARKYAV